MCSSFLSPHERKGQKCLDVYSRPSRSHQLPFSVCDPLTCIMSTIFLSSAGLIPDACCMVKPLKFSIRTKPLICVSSFSSSFSKMTQ